MKEMLREQGLLLPVCSLLQQPWCTIAALEGEHKVTMGEKIMTASGRRQKIRAEAGWCC